MLTFGHNRVEDDITKKMHRKLAKPRHDQANQVDRDAHASPVSGKGGKSHQAEYLQALVCYNR